VFDQVRTLRFRKRFGGTTYSERRCYKYPHLKGGYYPLDERFGIEKCRGFSPFPTFLQVMFGSSRLFEESAELLSKALRFSISSAALQWNTEQAGRQLSDDAQRVIEESWRMKGCEEIVVQMDSTTSPQITPLEGVTGRESLKAPTEWKMCHVGTLQWSKRADDKKVLRARVAKINNYLESHYRPIPKQYTFTVLKRLLNGYASGAVCRFWRCHPPFPLGCCQKPL
jgi:hypothetical protein